MTANRLAPNNNHRAQVAPFEWYAAFSPLHLMRLGSICACEILINREYYRSAYYRMSGNRKRRTSARQNRSLHGLSFVHGHINLVVCGVESIRWVWSDVLVLAGVPNMAGRIANARNVLRHAALVSYCIFHCHFPRHSANEMEIKAIHARSPSYRRTALFSTCI